MKIIYRIGTTDTEGKQLDGNNTYMMKFLPGQLPEDCTDNFWDMIVFCLPGYNVFPNPVNRYKFNSHSPLIKEKDGSLNIWIGTELKPGMKKNNWLPSPDGDFMFQIRLYEPFPGVIKGTHAFRPVVKMVSFI